jgi:prolyl oligopeptidase
MIHRRLAVFLLGVLVLSSCSARRMRRGREVEYDELKYPVTRTVDHVDVYDGHKVADPYRWLEDVDSEETRAWVEAQNKLTFEFLGDIRGRKRIRRRLEELVDHERYGVPRKRGGRYFYRYNKGLQEQSVLYVAESLAAEPRLLIDPNEFSEDGSVGLSRIFPSPDGNRVCYSISRSGSDWREFRVRDVESGQDLAADELKWIKFSGASWLPDGSAFFYTRLPEPEPGKELTGTTRGGKVYLHRIGTTQADDVLVWERPDQPDWSLSCGPTEDGKYLIGYAWSGSAGHNALFVKELGAEGPLRPLITDMQARWYVLGNRGAKLVVYTDLEAPNGQVIELDLDNPSPEGRKVLVPPGPNPIEDSLVAGDRIVLHYLHRAHSRLKVFALDGTAQGDIALPGLGSVYQLRGYEYDPEVFFGYSGFTVPARSMRYDLASGKLDTFRAPHVDFDPDDYTTRQVAYRGRDGTYITMFIVHRSDLEIDGRRPTLLHGYGGFNNSITPYFSPSNVVWMEMGGILALPNLRGGGEYGNKWHLAATKKNKQTTFDDFIAAAEALIYNGYTVPEKLAISGGSNGGLLVGACMTQRPDLFGACLPAVGVMDMLRYHKFTVGYAWAGEYGTSDDPEMFPVLRAYSPYHNIRPGVEYPATLVTTSDHDDRVVPAHSYKFAARLQACQGGPAPILLRVETKGGHGGGSSLSRALDLAADRYAFLAKTLGMGLPRRLGR